MKCKCGKPWKWQIGGIYYCNECFIAKYPQKKGKIELVSEECDHCSAPLDEGRCFNCCHKLNKVQKQDDGYNEMEKDERERMFRNMR